MKIINIHSSLWGYNHPLPIIRGKWKSLTSHHLGKVKIIPYCHLCETQLDPLIFLKWKSSHPIIWGRCKLSTPFNICEVKLVHILPSGEGDNHPHQFIFVKTIHMLSSLRGENQLHPLIWGMWKLYTYSPLCELKDINILRMLQSSRFSPLIDIKIIYILSSGKRKNHPHPLTFVRWKSSTSLWGQNNPHHLIFVMWQS